MLQASVLEFLRQHNIQPQESPVLLAVSGGVDSMVMLHQFSKAGIPCAAAHVNFGLRGAESDGDENLVRETCAEYNLPVHVLQADTESYAREKGISIQMAARELRYQFFGDLCKAYGYAYIATAHHANDNLEHFFLYLLRNSNETAFSGIAPVRDNIIRPFLQVSKCDIADYARQNNLQWREDSSNEKMHYLRNKIRHMIIPGLENLNPGLLQEFTGISTDYRNWYQHRQMESEERLNRVTSHSGSREMISANPDEIQYWPAFENRLRGLGFTRSQINNMGQAKTGSEFSSAKYQLRKTKDGLVIAKAADEQPTYFIEMADAVEQAIKAGAFELQFSQVNQMEPAQSAYYFDADIPEYPLVLRSWRQGDRMQPFGMKGTRLLSDMFTDAGISGNDRLKYPVLEDGKGILALVGLRRSALAMVNDESKELLKLQFSFNVQE